MITTYLKRVFGPSKKEQLERAIYDHAFAASNVEHYRTEIASYTTLLAQIDYKTQWWDYADAKEHLETARADYMAACDQAQKAKAKVDEVMYERF